MNWPGWLRMGKSKADRQFEILDGRLIDLQSEICNLSRKVDGFMATQEERLQAILVAVQNVKQMLTDLKNNNPAIEDEIAAIEAELAPASEPTPGA